MTSKRVRSAVFAFVCAILIAGCGRHENREVTSKVMDETSTNADQNAPGVSIQAGPTGGMPLKDLVNPVLWARLGHGDLRPEIPECGEKIPGCTADMDATYCEFRAEETRKKNFKAGYYLARVGEFTYCQKRCSPEKPTCKGWKCIGNYASYAGKKLMEWTDACQNTCRRAIRDEIYFPYECRNLNDQFNRQELIEEIKKKEAAALKDPVVQKKLRELEAINAQNADTEQRIAAMEAAEKALPAWVDAVYRPKMAALVQKMQAADDKILLLVARLNKDVGPVQGAAIATQNSLLSGTVTAETLDANRKALEAAKPLSCQVYAFDPLVRDAENVALQMQAVGDELLAKLEEVGNKPLIESTKKDLETLFSRVKPTAINDEVRSGRFPREVCEHFRKMLLANSLSLTLKDVGDNRAQIGQLVARLNTELARIDAMDGAAALQKTLYAQADFLGSAIADAIGNSRWNQGHRLAIESYKALHLMFIPAVEMAEGMSPDTKKLVIDTLTKSMTAPISAWNNIAVKTGARTMVMGRTAKLQRLLTQTAAKVEAITDAARKEALGADFRGALARATLKVKLDTMKMPTSFPTEETELVAYDDELSEFENILKNFNAVSLGGAQ